MGTRSGLESTLVGVTGEYFVAAELSARGYIASITLRNSRGIDIIASSPDASRSVSIQVKTSSGGGPKWLLTKKSEAFCCDNHYYVFVLLHGVGMRPDFHIVPSDVVAEHISTNHRQWLARPKADGSPRKDSSMRNFRDSDGKYKERWTTLNL
ncbi:MAG: aspartate ammonia-lyase [Gemmatimonadota bacterium]|nr:aspartate ammonia-lyase [Gemmatimonadota bacterium]